MFDRYGIRGLTDNELESDSAFRIQDIQRRLARISERLTVIAIGLWVLLGYLIWHFEPH